MQTDNSDNTTSLKISYHVSGLTVNFKMSIIYNCKYCCQQRAPCGLSNI